MGTSERSGPQAGPGGGMGQAYSNGLELFAKSSEPLVKEFGRWNIEVMGFATRRARAWAELGSRVSQCKTPQDLAREQLQFWQSAVLDYTDSARRLTLAFGALAGSALIGPSDDKDAPARDYISFPEASPAAQETPPQRERRAA